MLLFVIYMLVCMSLTTNLYLQKMFWNRPLCVYTSGVIGKLYVNNFKFSLNSQFGITFYSNCNAHI